MIFSERGMDPQFVSISCVFAGHDILMIYLVLSLLYDPYLYRVIKKKKTNFDAL